LKIAPQLPKLLTNIKWLTFLEHGVYHFGDVTDRRQTDLRCHLPNVT